MYGILFSTNQIFCDPASEVFIKPMKMRCTCMKTGLIPSPFFTHSVQVHSGAVSQGWHSVIRHQKFLSNQ